MMEASRSFVEVQNLSSQQAAQYLSYVKEAKAAAKNGDLEDALKLFNLAKDIFPNKKVMSRIQKLQEALKELAEEENDEFTDVCDSGLLLYRGLHDQLFEYQKEGVAFLYSLYRDGKKGGILADDMGLGKTVQIIAFLSGMFDAAFVKHVLLIMPTSLINTWTKEFAKWTPGMRVKTFHGPSKNERSRNLLRVQQRNGIVITTYQMLISNCQHLAYFSGQEFVWDYVILDEAHKIKSSFTKTAICARTVPARNRLLLTGTPIQNNLQELWSLFDFACQGSLLGTLKTFKIEYENPIVRAREKDATPGEKALGFKISENLMAIIKPYFLRRTKEEVQKKKPSDPEVRPNENSPGVDPICEMPSLSRKNDLIVWIRLVPLQEEIYRKFISLDHIKALLMETRSPLAELNVLKKLCDHPRLLSARVCGLLNLRDTRLCAGDISEEESSEVYSIDHITEETLMKESGKMIFLMSLLKRLQDEGHQTLVFSQSRQILNIIERLLKSKHFKVLRIDGTVTHLWEREKRIQLFQQNKEYSVFLLTTLVGGVGLTLTAATRVVIFDPSWNPATDAQAVDRVYRIGQKENVVIYRLITCGTIEEKIYRRQIFKDSLIRQTTGDKKNPFRYFTKQELRELFTIEDFQNSATQLQLQSLHAAQRRSDEKLDEHIAYLHSLGIAGLSDHDLMFTRDLSIKEELDVIEESSYIQQRVERAQFLVESESQYTVGKQTAECEEDRKKVSLLASQTKKRWPKLNKPQPQPSPFVTARYTQEDDISSQMATISLDDQSQEGPQDLSSVLVNATMKQDGSHPYENTFDADSTATLPTGLRSAEGMWTEPAWRTAEVCAVEDEAGQKEALQERPNQEALQESPLGSLNPLLSQSVGAEAEPGPTLDLQDSEVVHSCSVWPIDDEKNKRQESNISIIEVSHDILSASQVSEASAEEKRAASSPQYACDFNLFLEDSADSRQNLSHQSLEHVGKEESSCGSSVHSRAPSVHNFSLNSSRKDETQVVVNVKTRSKARRIISDDEDEDDFLQGTSSASPFSTSSFEFTSVKQFDASTPKNDASPSKRFFSPKKPESVNKSTSSRRSLASRRSLINVVLDHVEDMEEELGDCEAEGAAADPQGEGGSDECTGEEPFGETLPSRDEPSKLQMSEPPSPALQPSSGAAPEPPSDEPLVDSPQEKAVEVANDYETLVAHGKKLKESGKIQEALNCFVKALDIKSADPEVMLMTLSLYKQLSNT